MQILNKTLNRSITSLKLVFQHTLFVFVLTNLLCNFLPSRLRRFLQYPLLILISPMSLYIVACVVHSVVFQGVTEPGELLVQGWTTLQSSMVETVVDSYLFWNWTFSLVSLTIVPCWCLFWSVLWSEPY